MDRKAVPLLRQVPLSLSCRIYRQAGALFGAFAFGVFTSRIVLGLEVDSQKHSQRGSATVPEDPSTCGPVLVGRMNTQSLWVWETRSTYRLTWSDVIFRSGILYSQARNNELNLSYCDLGETSGAVEIFSTPSRRHSWLLLRSSFVIVSSVYYQSWSWYLVGQQRIILQQGLLDRSQSLCQKWLCEHRKWEIPWEGNVSSPNLLTFESLFAEAEYEI